jgi:hypothetical protein
VGRVDACLRFEPLHVSRQASKWPAAVRVVEAHAPVPRHRFRRRPRVCCAVVRARSSRRPVPIGVPPPAWCTRARVGRRCVRAPAMTATGTSGSPQRAPYEPDHRAGSASSNRWCDRSRAGGPLRPCPSTSSTRPPKQAGAYGQVVPSPPDPSNKGCCDEYSNPRPPGGQFSAAVECAVRRWEFGRRCETSFADPVATVTVKLGAA